MATSALAARKYHVMRLLKPKRGRPRRDGFDRWQDFKAFAALILELNSTLEFRVSSRGWGYILENEGWVTKGDLDRAQEAVNECRKFGYLPVDICLEDGSREFRHLENLDGEVPGEVEAWVNTILHAHEGYTPLSFWDGQEYYLEMLVEKIDLRSLFQDLCARFHIPLANAKGWSDINTRVAMLRRFREHTEAGRRCVVLYCGDHDPAGLQISDNVTKNLLDVCNARDSDGVRIWDGCTRDDFDIDRFGLNYRFIEENGLTWIDGLETSSGKQANEKLPHVKQYIRRFGRRKCEANALVVRPAEGRELCRQAILKYLPEDAPQRYEERLAPHRERLKRALRKRVR
jgi:hypothetical protein